MSCTTIPGNPVKGRPPNAVCGHLRAKCVNDTTKTVIVYYTDALREEHPILKFDLVGVCKHDFSSVEKIGCLGKLVKDWDFESGILRLDNERYPEFWMEIDVKAFQRFAFN